MFCSKRTLELVELSLHEIVHLLGSGYHQHETAWLVELQFLHLTILYSSTYLAHRHLLLSTPSP